MYIPSSTRQWIKIESDLHCTFHFIYSTHKCCCLFFLFSFKCSGRLKIIYLIELVKWYSHVIKDIKYLRTGSIYVHEQHIQHKYIEYISILFSFFLHSHCDMLFSCCVSPASRGGGSHLIVSSLRLYILICYQFYYIWYWFKWILFNLKLNKLEWSVCKIHPFI